MQFTIFEHNFGTQKVVSTKKEKRRIYFSPLTITIFLFTSLNFKKSPQTFLPLKFLKLTILKKINKNEKKK